MFAWSYSLSRSFGKAAQQAAMIYSFRGTCNINNAEPFAWLKKVLTIIPDYSVQKLEDLLPGNLPVWE